MRQSAPLQDPEIVDLAVERAREGDTNALFFLYVRFADDVFTCVDNIVHSLDDSRDITQGVFERLMTTLQRYQPHDIPFPAWILHVSRNAALDHMVARDDAQLREVLLSLRGRRLPLPRQILEGGAFE